MSKIILYSHFIIEFNLYHSHPRSLNIGPDFQAELPDFLEEIWPEEPVREELLWKPWAELEQSDNVLQHGKQYTKIFYQSDQQNPYN